MLQEPLTKPEAVKLARQILKEGNVVFTTHATERATERQLSSADVENVVERGLISAEPEANTKGQWSYKIETPQMVVVVGFRSETEMRIVTTWRKS